MKNWLFAVINLFLAGSPLVLAQTTPSPVDIGLQAYHDYQGGNIDHVNLDNGNLTLTIPMVSYPQRGNTLKMDFDVVYNGTGRVWTKYCLPVPVSNPPAPQNCTWEWMPASHASVASSLTPQTFTASPGLYDMQDVASAITTLSESSVTTVYYQTNWYTADGGQHSSGQTSNGQISLDGSGFQANYTESYVGGRSIDTCIWACTLPNIVSSPALLQTKGGISWLTSQSANYLARVDADGNYITTAQGTKTDTAGRVIPAPVLNTSPTAAQTSICPGPLAITEIATWSPPGFSGSYTFCYASVSLSIGEQLNSGAILHLTPAQTMLQSIVLPNGQSWLFEYNESLTNCPGDGTTNVGDLTHITYPTGGTIDYTYTCVMAPALTAGNYMTVVASRTVNANDGTGAHTWTYSYGGIGNVTVTDPAMNDKTDILSSSGLTRVTTQYLGTGSSRTAERTTTTAYLNSPVTPTGFPILPSSQTVMLENGLSSETTYQYCCAISFFNTPTGIQKTANYGKVTDAKYYDWTSGTTQTLLKEVQTSYLFQSNTNYMNPGFLDLPSTVTILNGSGSQMAQTTYAYDTTARVTSGIASISGSQTGTPIFSVYGHPNSATKWLNTGGTSPTTTMTYYDTGEAYQVTDPKGNTSSSYFCTGSTPTVLPCTASTYLGVLPTAISNALGQTSTFTYRSDTGQKISVTDPNHQTTTYSYVNPSTGINDPLNRLTKITSPDVFPGTSTQGETDIQYNDTGNIGVTVTEKITPSVSRQTQAVVDGLGREVETMLLSDPSGTTYTRTSFDALGRTYQVWNPTRCNPFTQSSCSGEGTWGITTHQYDELSREVLTIPPDGTASHNNESTSYSGNTSTVTDQAGVSRQQTLDALGRLTQVTEVNPGWVTLYNYDALGNLLCVEQHGGVTGTGCSSAQSSDATSPWRVRRFTYDSLSRLLTAQNPETGENTPISYTYDSNGNMIQRTDARGVVTNYSPSGSPIDALNRVTKKTYSSGDPSVTYSYDSTSVTNGIGRRTGMTDASGSTTWNYDAVGRVTNELKTINGLSKTTSTSYNLDGSPYQIAYPSGTVMTYSIGGAGAVLSATDSTHGINYASGLVYAPMGAMTGAVYGTVPGGFSGIALADTFNSRMQPITLSATSTAGLALSLGYNFNFGSADNGNVYGVTNGKSSARSQTFSYDNVNRLQSAQSGTWGFNTTIDPWGNLYQTSGISGTSLLNPMPVPADQTATVQNHLASNLVTYSYSGGDMTQNNAESSTFDGENRIATTAGATYTYDGDGERVVKSTGTLYWGGLTESDLSGNITSEYVFVNGKRVARRDISGSAVYYYFSDFLGSSNVVTNATGVIQNESDFYPFGGENQISDALNNQHFKFSGKERDAESGLDDFGARYYGSNMGRFMSADWAAKATPVPYAKLTDPQSLNLFAYVGNNPESLVDADGHQRGFSCDLLCEQGMEDYQQQIQNDYVADFWDKVSALLNAGNNVEVTWGDGSASLYSSAQQQSQSSSTTTQTQSTDYVSVSYWPKGAGGFGHIGIGVDTDDTQGYSTKDPKTSIWKRIFGAPVGGTEDDIQAHTKNGEVAPHSYLHIPISADQAAAMRGAMDARTANGGHYNLIFNNCAQFVESVLHAGGVSGVPHAEVFGPAILGGILWAEH